MSSCGHKIEQTTGRQENTYASLTGSPRGDEHSDTHGTAQGRLGGPASCPHCPAEAEARRHLVPSRCTCISQGRPDSRSVLVIFRLRDPVGTCLLGLRLGGWGSPVLLEMRGTQQPPSQGLSSPTRRPLGSRCRLACTALSPKPVPAVLILAPIVTGTCSCTMLLSQERPGGRCHLCLKLPS